MRIERSEVGQPGEFRNIADDELEHAIIERFARIGLERELAISDGSSRLNGADTDITDGS